jgi:hypothetical protein
MLKGNFPLAVRGEPDHVSFRGEGYGFVHQTVAGDFTLTARIADMPLTTKENGLWPSNWLGLSIRSKHSNPDVHITDKGPYNSEISLFLTAEGTMKGAKDFPDLAGSNKSIASFEGDHRWLRLVRRARRYQSFTSADGKRWQLAGERFATHSPEEVYAGVSFRSGPNKSRSLFQGTIDELKLENTIPQERREEPRIKDLSLKNRITAIVQATKDPQMFYARSTDKGLFQIGARGEGWGTVNFGLTDPDAMAVRSVAVHPKNSAIVLRAGGSVVAGELKSGLWRSEDAGGSWKLMTREIDFDGSGPTTLFGEVVMFCPQAPNLVVAGGETKGLFLSRDTGKTWTNIALIGERITSMAFSPQSEKKPQAPTLVVGTFDDNEFKTLGLGHPATPVEAPARIYWITLSDGEKAIKPGKAAELEDFGITNMVFDTESNFVNLATTRGVFYTWGHGTMHARRKLGTTSDRLFIAIGARPFDKWSKLTCAAPFSGAEKTPVYFTTERSRKWSLLSESDNGPLSLNAGISCLLPDSRGNNRLYLCNRHGIFKTSDGGKTYTLVLPATK